MPKLETWDYDMWSVVCLLCSEDLAVDGARPAYGVTTKHLAKHGVEYRTCFPTKSGYSVERTNHPDGSFDSVSTSIHAEDAGRGREVIIAIRSFGTLPSEKPQEARKPANR